jgi:hypothetical protein
VTPGVTLTLVEANTIIATSANSNHDCTLTIEQEFGLLPDQSGPTGVPAIGTMSGTVSDGTTSYPFTLSFHLTDT